MRLWSGRALVLLLISAGLLSACGQSQPSRLYTLSDMAGTVPSETAAEQGRIGLGPVRLPAYLDRPQMVTRQSPYRLEIAEFDRWAEPLKDTVPRILAEDLGFILGSDRVYLVPQRRPRDLDLSVSVEFLNFEATAEGAVVLVARWEIFDAEDDALIADGRTVVERTGAPPGDYEALTALLSEAFGAFAEVLAGELEQAL